jgi:hypothetical protein
MTPKTYFDDVWQRCELFVALHGYIVNQTTVALQPDELLRAEWAVRVSALDLYIHELVVTQLVEIFAGTRPICPGFTRFQVSGEALMRIQAAATPTDRNAAFDLEVRTRLGRITYQYPDDIAAGVRLVSSCQLWNEIAMKMGATPQTVTTVSASLRQQLSLIIDRRNKIVHEGDLQPMVPRTPWPITRADVAYVATFINDIVTAIDSIVV